MGKERGVRDTLLRFAEVKSAELTTGDQDILALVEADTYEDILLALVERLRALKGIISTVTDLVLE
jgi:hypothetical protein